MTTQRTHTQLLNLLSGRKIKPLEAYKNCRARLWFLCLACGNQWQTTPDSVLRGTGCPRCSAVRGGTKLRKKNKVIGAKDDYLIIDISTAARPGAKMKIDTADYARLLNIPIGRISLDSRGYCATWVGGKLITVHALVHPEWLITDHISMDTTDNRRINLREAPKAQNNMNRKLPRNNTSGYRGVVFDRGKWRASIGVNRKMVYLGRFDSKKEAVLARRTAELKYFKEFAPPWMPGLVLSNDSAIVDKYQKG